VLFRHIRRPPVTVRVLSTARKVIGNSGLLAGTPDLLAVVKIHTRVTPAWPRCLAAHAFTQKDLARYDKIPKSIFACLPCDTVSDDAAILSIACV